MTASGDHAAVALRAAARALASAPHVGERGPLDSAPSDSGSAGRGETAGVRKTSAAGTPGV